MHAYTLLQYIYVNQYNTSSQSAHTDYSNALSQLARHIPYAIVRNPIYRILEYRITTYRITTFRTWPKRIFDLTFEREKRVRRLVRASPEPSLSEPH